LVISRESGLTGVLFGYSEAAVQLTLNYPEGGSFHFELLAG
jgi:hypothetical protein